MEKPKISPKQFYFKFLKVSAETKKFSFLFKTKNEEKTIFANFEEKNT